ncbi:MAG: CRISPR system precrRNA processing endoribonuclease RAMP protein Cas6 [Acidobacteria bacterium]|nr:CRISPR system precrRNA processing endoribonuclease RAMP protein Cas6 [Acidobacteriota bacterium]
MKPQDFSQLDLIQLTFGCKSTRPATLPPFLGSTLRGAFGHAFKQVACALEGPTRCAQTCQQPAQCRYAFLFETAVPQHQSPNHRHQDIPHPYLLIPPLVHYSVSRIGFKEGDPLEFGIILMGEAINLVLLVTVAVELMLDQGLGSSRTPFQLASVTAWGKTQICSIEKPKPDTEALYAAITPLSNVIERRLAPLNPLAESLTLRFLTPLRLRKGGNLQDSIGFVDIVRHLMRRMETLTEAFGSAPPRVDTERLPALASQIQTTANSLWWNDMERFSNRQQTKLKLGGLMGEICFSGPVLAEFLPLLAAGEVLHIGTATTFGLGRYELLHDLK